MSFKLTPLRFLEKVKKIITENLIGGTNITLTTGTDNKVTIAGDVVELDDLSDVAYSDGDLTVTDGLRIVGLKKRIIDVDDALDLSVVATGLPYSGATFSLTQGDSESGFAITLPSADSEEEAIVLVGWHISIIITSSGSASVTVVRGAGGDTLVGTVVAGDAAASGITIRSHVITFVGGAAAEGDRVDITCVATPDRTDWVVQGFCAV